jgi:2-oxoglutarate dehydrogenase E2 component (dihydrolipoamide succinyltransferase)
MATVEVKVPPLPESVSDATVATWHKKPGDAVKRDENLVDLETDKVVLEVPSPCDGIVSAIARPSGSTVTSNQLLASIEEGAVAASASPAAAPVAAVSATAAPVAPNVDMGPAARRMVAENNLAGAPIVGTGRHDQVTKEDVVNYLKAPAPAAPVAPVALPASTGARSQERVPMTRIRQRIAERMMQSKNSIAMLTSFNEINLKAVMDIRKTFGEQFEKTHGIKLGFMSFFVKAVSEALKRHPVVNASTEGSDVIYHGYADVAIAVSTERGLVTPVLRNAELLTLAEIERQISAYAKKAREGGLALEDLQGGTFTITNGGTFGSLMSTPIVNPPQSAILGMHAIKDRPIAENGQVVIAPMMYVALSYDHRIIDGKDAVLFLVDVKNSLENPARLLLGL